MDLEEPLFIDKHYIAKALQDMVLVVQSNHTKWPGKIACNGNTVMWDLRNPLKNALSAVMLNLGGIVPSMRKFLFR